MDTGLDPLYRERLRGNRGWISSSARKVQQRRSAMKVKDVMHKGVDWVSPNTPVTELAKLMREHDIGCIPIGEDDRLIEMVNDRDIVRKCLPSNNLYAGGAMAAHLISVVI